MTGPSRLGDGVRRWVREHPILAFPLLYLGWAYLFWLPMLRSETSVWSFPNIVWFLLGGASPLVAGLGLAALDGGRTQLRDLARRLVDWRRIRPFWCLGILVFWLVFDLAMAGLAVLLGLTDAPLDVDWSLVVSPGPLVFLLLLSFVFPAVEGVGLRGYYLDALRRRLGLASAALLNGGVWAAWHAPFVFFPGYYANTTFHPELSWWLPMIVAHTVMFTYVYERTGRSLLAVLVFHGMMNFTGEWLRISPEMYPFMLFGTLVPAVVVLLSWRRSADSSVPAGRDPRRGERAER